MNKQAPEIFQRSLTSLDLTGLPPTTDSGFEQAIIMQYAMQYAAKGWTAAVVVSDGMVRVVAMPQQGIEPRLTCLACSNTAIEEFFEVLITDFERLDAETQALNEYHRTFPGLHDRWQILRKK